MGGRGGSGNFSHVSGVDVTKDGNTTRYYFTTRGGTHYYQRGIDGMPEPTPQNMSIIEFRERVETNGAITKIVSTSEQRREEIKRKAERKTSDKFLDEQWYKAGPRPRKGQRGH